MMGPPPQPGVTAGRPVHPQPDVNLTLPPLRTPTRPSPPLSASLPPSGDERFLLPRTIPYLLKIKLLGQIAIPVRSTANKYRGAFIAVEGEDNDAIDGMVTWLSGALGKDHTVHVRNGPQTPTADKAIRPGNTTLAEYLHVVESWHSKTDQLLTILQTPAAHSPNDKTPDSYKRAPSHNDDNNNNKPPMLVIPRYTLHASNVYASAIRIRDSYSPADHWQWVASLWRGVLGPDLTIYLRDHHSTGLKPSTGVQHSKSGSKTCDGHSILDGEERVVELQADARALVVKREPPPSLPTPDSEGQVVPGVAEATLRRVAFEVGEWVRALGE